MGGATISFLNLLKGIVEKNVECIVVHPKPKENDVQLVELLKEIGCKTYELPVAVCYKSKSLKIIKSLLMTVYKKFQNARFYTDLLKIVKLEKPDVIHTNTGVIHQGYKVAKKLKIPHVWHLREYQTLDFDWKILPSENKFKQYLNDSYTVCITKDIQKYFELSENKNSFVIYNPIMKIMDVNVASAKENFFLIANRVSKEKGIEDAIVAFADFAKLDSSYKLKIAGFGNNDYIRKLKNMCVELHIEDKVDFLGFVSDVSSLMVKAKALLVASYSEGFGRMTAEANMLGIPVIGRNSAGTKEILEQTEGGILFNTQCEFTNALEKFSKMNDFQMGNFMRSPKLKACELFCTEQHVQKIYSLYSKIFTCIGGGTNIK